MKRAPRDPKAPLFGTRDILLSFLQGTFVLLAVLIESFLD
jgi:hypothetical protein